MKQRSPLIDAAKGLGILLVVLGHSIQFNNGGFDNMLFRIIYSFHMPLFIFLSGCVAKYGDQRSITKNIPRLVVPFFAWYVISYFVQWIATGIHPDVFDYVLRLIINVDNGLWFLWVLFLCHVFFYLMYEIQTRLGFIAAGIAYLFISLMPFNILGTGLLSFHFSFFLAGYLAFRYQAILLKWRYYIVPVAAITYLVLFPYWQFNANDRLINSLSWVPDFVKSHESIIARPFRYATSFSGIIIMITIVYFLIQITKVKELLTTMGLYTLEIYVSHQLFLFAFGENFSIRVVIAFSIALSASLTLAFLLKKMALTRAILYGMPSPKVAYRLKHAEIG